jgi:hypothetical protein
MKQQPPMKLVESAPEGTVWFGGTVDRSKVSLRIFGDDLIPLEITNLLGHEPTESQTKGKAWVTPSGRERTAKTGSWSLKAPVEKPADLDFQIDWIFSQLTSDLTIWNQLTEKFTVDLFAGLFLEAQNRGLSISSKSMTLIGERGIDLGLDIYNDEEK